MEMSKGFILSDFPKNKFLKFEMFLFYDFPL